MSFLFVENQIIFEEVYVPVEMLDMSI